MYFDWTYVYLVLPAFVLALIASAGVKSTFAKYNRQMSASGITGAEAARRILYANGLTNVTIERINGSMTDHYDPRANVIRLSQAVYDGSSTASIGVAAHEVGHALQYAEGYAPIKLRAAIIPITNIGSTLAIPVVFIGIIFASFSKIFISVAYAGILFFALSTVFQLLTLPVEFNASRRALNSIEAQGMLSGNELTGSKRVLRAAAMTYVAALAVSVAQLLRLLLIVRRND